MQLSHLSERSEQSVCCVVYSEPVLVADAAIFAAASCTVVASTPSAPKYFEILRILVAKISRKMDRKKAHWLSLGSSLEVTATGVVSECIVLIPPAYRRHGSHSKPSELKTR